jgi:hypothetical protein
MNVPAGRSYWEFGTNESYKSKATDDFDKRTGKVPKDEQRDTTFVFVTPWTWDSSDPKNKIEDWVKAALIGPPSNSSTASPDAQGWIEFRQGAGVVLKDGEDIAE